MSLRLAGTSLLIALGVVAVPLGSISSAGASGTPGGSSIVSGAAEAGPGVAELGVTPSAAPLQIDVGLEPRDPAALSAFVTSVSTPGSPDYRHYLAKGQFGPMFGPTAATVAAVRSALTQSGLKVGALFDSMLLPVTTTAAGAQKAFGVTMHSFRLASGKVVNANVTAAHLPSAIAPLVSGVAGLDNLDQLQPLAHASAAPLTPSSAGSSGGLAPGQPSACSAGSGEWDADAIAQAYDFGPLYQAGDYGQGQTVALFEGSGYSVSDVAAYQACYGTSVPIQIEPTSATNGSPSDEANLDIEDVVGLAPKITRVLFYPVQSTFPGTYGQIASDDLAQVVSSSWGTCEANSGGDPALEEPIFAQMASQGQSMFAASGDEGSEACNATGSEPPFDDALAVGDPAGQPFVTGVGGTALSAPGNPPTTPPTETVWNSRISDGFAFAGPTPGSTAPGAGNGGMSSYWPMPAYQQGTGVINSYSSSAPCAGAAAPTTLYTESSSGDCREVPDVSANAGGGDPFFTGAAPGSWEGFLGTSIASPDWAAMTALINASTSTSACDTPPKDVHWGSVGLLNPALYQLATSTPSDFNDITAPGNNDMTGTNSGSYPTTVGYDMATGLGSPVAANLAQSLCPRTPITVTVSGSQTFNSSSPTFSQTNNAPAGVTVSGTLSCPSVNGGTAISSALAVGSYTLDALQCTGITDSKPLSYVIDYVGTSGDFVVAKDSTKTTLGVSSGSEPYGHEKLAIFTVSVATTNGEELPETDDVNVQVGGTTVCVAHVAPVSGGGQGSCSPTSETVVGAGNYTATADYGGDGDLAGSNSSTPFDVTKDSTLTTLKVSPGTEPYGQENAALFTVSVATTNGEELPETDDVNVQVGGTTVCVAHVAPASGGGQGTCSPTSGTVVYAGDYTATADYGGDSDLTGSNSATPFDVTLVLTSPPLPNPTWEMPYTTTITAAGAAPGPVTFSEVGALPTGVHLAANGVLSGIPTAKPQINQVFPFTVTANGPNSATGSQAYSITLESPCSAGLTPYFLTATSNTGDFLGFFCTNGAGTGAYTQYSPGYVLEIKGTGSVSTSGPTTRIFAFGTNLALLGQESYGFSTFTETAPGPEKGGTFTLL